MKSRKPHAPGDPLAAAREENQALLERVRVLEHELQLRAATRALSAESGGLEATRGLLSATGQSFFRSLLAHLSEALHADHAFVGELVPDAPGRARTIALLADGQEAENIEYELRGSPCEQVFTDTLCIHTEHVQALYPSDALLAEIGAEGYAATPLRASDGRVLGLLAVTRRERIDDPVRSEALLRLFAARAAAELERLQSEEKLRRSEMLLRGILDHSTSAIYVKDLDGRYVLVNREFETASGIPRTQAQGRSPAELLPEPDVARIEAHEREVIERGVPVRRELSVTLLGRGERTYIVDKVPLFDAGQHVLGTCTIATDITEHQQLQAQLVRAQRMESIGQLAGGVAHDFNNLITAISGYTSLARSALPAEHPALEDLALAEKACARAATLTDQLLTFARRQVVEPRIVDLRRLLEDLRGLLRPVLSESIRLDVRAAPGLWSVRADPGQLEQVFMNLAVNARDAMPGGGTLDIVATNLTRSVPGEAAGAPTGDVVEIRVRDTGQGIPEEVRPHLFEPFFTTKAAEQGTGLGLATCFGIVEQSGGNITFESRVGEGTTFTVLLPRAAGVPATLPPGRGEAAESRGSETILVVEDDALVRDLVVRSLRHAGYAVLEAEGGEAALALAAANPGPIGLLLTDVVMPGMNGPELAERLTRARPVLRVLLMSGYADVSIARGVSGAGDWPVLRKPYTPLELSRRVREILDGAGV